MLCPTADREASHTNHMISYPYPLFELLSTSQRVGLFTFAAALNATSSIMLKWLYGKLNGLEKFQKEAANPVKLD